MADERKAFQENLDSLRKWWGHNKPERLGHNFWATLYNYNYPKAEMGFLKAIQHISWLLPNISHMENGQVDCLHSLTIVFGMIKSQLFLPLWHWLQGQTCLSIGPCGVLMCTVSTERTTLKDQPCTWPSSLGGTPKTVSERAVYSSIVGI